MKHYYPITLSHKFPLFIYKKPQRMENSNSRKKTIRVYGENLSSGVIGYQCFFPLFFKLYLLVSGQIILIKKLQIRNVVRPTSDCICPKRREQRYKKKQYTKHKYPEVLVYLEYPSKRGITLVYPTRHKVLYSPVMLTVNLNLYRPPLRKNGLRYSMDFR